MDQLVLVTQAENVFYGLIKRMLHMFILVPMTLVAYLSWVPTIQVAITFIFSYFCHTGRIFFHPFL